MQSLPKRVRVVRDWPNGPALGAVITPPATRRAYLLSLGVVVPADDEPPEPDAHRPRRRRGTPHHPEQADGDLLAQRHTRG